MAPSSTETQDCLSFTATRTVHRYSGPLANCLIHMLDKILYTHYLQYTVLYIHLPLLRSSDLKAVYGNPVGSCEPRSYITKFRI